MDEILAGKYISDERIPGVREYSLLLQVNVNTTVKAFDILARQGIIYNKRGLGSFVSADAVKIIRRLRSDDVLNGMLQELAKQMYLLGIPMERSPIACNNSSTKRWRPQLSVDSLPLSPEVSPLSSHLSLLKMVLLSSALLAAALMLSCFLLAHSPIAQRMLHRQRIVPRKSHQSLCRLRQCQRHLRLHGEQSAALRIGGREQRHHPPPHSDGQPHGDGEHGPQRRSPRPILCGRWGTESGHGVSQLHAPAACRGHP